MTANEALRHFDICALYQCTYIYLTSLGHESQQIGTITDVDVWDFASIILKLLF